MPLVNRMPARHAAVMLGGTVKDTAYDAVSSPTVMLMLTSHLVPASMRPSMAMNTLAFQ